MVMLFTLGCDLNPLGGDKSKLDPLFEPGKHVQSQPPTISPIANFTMDENDVQTLNFTIGDPDTIMLCSLIFVKGYSSNNTLIDGTGLLVGGVFPNCTVRISPKALQYGLSNIKMEVYDFWTKVSSTFQLTVVHILTPGAFSIIDAEGKNQAIEVTWGLPAYMSGTSARYNAFYRVTGSATTFTRVPNVSSPYTITGLTNGTLYDIYIEARNAVGFKNSQTVQAQPGRFKVFGGEFIAASTQFANSAGTSTNVQIVNSTMTTTEAVTDPVNYPAIAYDLAESPPNSAIPVGFAKPSAITSKSGKYKVYMSSQGNILSGDAP